MKILLLLISIIVMFLHFFGQRNKKGIIQKVSKNYFFSQDFSNDFSEYESLISTKTNIPNVVKRANENDSESMTELASIIARGVLVKRNYTKAIEWYEKAIKLENIKAIIGLADLYYQLWQDTSNIHYLEKSIELLKSHIDKNNPNILYKLGLVLYDTQKERKNQGLELIKKSAAQGYIPAILDLAAIYEYKNNTEKSEALLKQAWELGSYEAGHILVKKLSNYKTAEQQKDKNQ